MAWIIQIVCNLKINFMFGFGSNILLRCENKTKENLTNPRLTFLSSETIPSPIRLLERAWREFIGVWGQ